MKGDQLGLLLWKNYVVRKRRPGILGLTFIWPVIVFMILYAVRDNVDPKYHPTCHFPARLMPHDGLLPFVQSFICSLNNPCEPLSEYELMPSYKNATLGPILQTVQPLLENDTILSAVKTMPKGIRLLKSMAEILTKPEIKQLFDSGIRLGDLFNNHELIKRSLVEQLPKVGDDFIDSIFNASIKLLYLIETFGSSNIDGIVCSPESLKKYLILEREEDLAKLSKVLCEIDSAKIPGILAQMTSHLDFGELLEVVNRAMAKFRDYDFLDDIQQTVQQILKLNIIEKYVPTYLRIREWLPKIIPLFRHVTFREIDLNFINNSITVLRPIFAEEKKWSSAERGLLRLNSLLDMIQKINVKREASNAHDITILLERIGGFSQQLFTMNSVIDDNVIQAIDLTYLILQDGIILTNALLDHHKGEMQIAAEVFDGLRHFFNDKIMNTFTYLLSLTQNFVKIVHQVAVIHGDLADKMLEVTRKHGEFVQRMFHEIDPSAYRIVIRTFSRLEMIERLIAKLKLQKAGTVICQEDTLNEIFDDFKEMKSQAQKINSLLCSDAGQEYISDIYEALQIDNFGQIVDDVLKTFIQMFVRQPVQIEKSNLTSVVQSVKHFVTYLTSTKVNNTNQVDFSVPVNWKNAFTDTQAKGRLIILGIYLSVAKAIGSKSYSIVTVKPGLRVMDSIADVILKDLDENPTQWIAETRKHENELIESFYLTVSDRKKVLEILGCYNFTETYCRDSASPEFVNYPANANKTVLKSIVCRLSGIVQSDLQLNVTMLKQQRNKLEKARDFNWTSFNEKVVRLYEYVDSLVHQENLIDNDRLQTLKNDFNTAWIEDITLKDAFEISVGFLCKIFDILESPLFDVGASPLWNNLYALSWASSLLFDGVENIVDQIQRNNRTVELNEILKDMPQTQNLMTVILRNIAPIILDFVDVTTLKAPIHFITTINEYQLRETDWPCLKNGESIGAALELRNGSQEVIREIEKIACKPETFIKEWLEQPLLSKVHKILLENGTERMTAFNWTQGYLNFRRLNKKLDILSAGTEEIILKDDPSLTTYGEVFLSEVQKVIEDRLPDLQKDASDLLHYVDLEVDNVIRSRLPGNLSASSVWQSKERNANYYVTLAKFLSVVINNAAELILQILDNKDPQNIEMLSVLGFENKSVVSIVYHRLPYILTTLINALSDPDIDNRIAILWEDGKMVSCAMVFSWFSDHLVGLSADDFMTIKNFTCDSDPEFFNSYIDLIMDATVTWKRPIQEYRVKFMSMFMNLHKVGVLIDYMISNDVNIIVPFSGNDFIDMTRLLRKSLSTKVSNSKNHPEVTNYRLIIEGVSEAMSNVAEALRDSQIRDNQLHTWDLFKHDEAKKLLRLLETYPVQTIALFATMTWIDSRTRHFVPFRSLRRTICDLDFNSEFWSRSDSKRFLYELCAFDPYELLAGVTSDEYRKTLQLRKSSFKKTTPLASSVALLVDEILNVAHKFPNVIFISNVFNITTYMNLPNETLVLLDRAEESWVHKLIVTLESSNVSQPFKSVRNEYHLRNSLDVIYNSPFSQITRTVQLFTSFIDISSGGDIWQKIRQMYVGTKIQTLFSIVEDLPNLALTIAYTFINSERLLEFGEMYLDGRANPCDIDKYLIPPSFMRKKSLLSSITNLCHRLIQSNEILTVKDFLPFDSKTDINKYTYEVRESIKLNETFLLEKVRQLRLTLFRSLADGSKELKIPTWWTSFKEGTFKDFRDIYNKKDLRSMAHLASKKLLKFLKKNILSHYIKDNDCEWCNTFILEILNSQLIRHSAYADFVCNIYNMKPNEIEQVMLNDFNWNKTINMIKAFRILNTKKNLEDFMATLDNTVHYITDIIIDFQNETYREIVDECFYKYTGGPSLSRPGLYMSMIIGALNFIERNIYIVDTASSHEKLLNLTNMMEKHVTIWKPLAEVSKESDLTSISQFLPNAMINVNLIVEKRANNKNDTSFIYKILSSKKSQNLLHYDARAAKYPTIHEISMRIAQSLDFDLINRKIRRWRRDAATDLTWLKKMVKNVAFVIDESSSLLDVASQIDFESITDALGAPDLVDGVVNILKDKTIDKLFDGLRELLDDSQPFINDESVMHDLHRILNITESMEIFKNLGLLDLTYTIRDLFGDWDVFRRYLVEEVHLTNDIVSTLSGAKVDMLSVFMKEQNAITLKDTICSPEKLGAVLNFDRSQISSDQVSDVLCQLDNEHTLNIVIILIRNLNFDYIMTTLMNANVKNIFKNANLTEEEAKDVVENLGVASELVSLFKDKLPKFVIQDNSMESTSESQTAMSNLQFLSDSSKLLCGKQLISMDNNFYQVLASIEDNSKQYDDEELKSLPTEFCRNTYKAMVGMKGGKIVWSYVKPLLRGRILYSPNVSAIDDVMHIANKTFLEMDKFSNLVDHFHSILISLASLTEMNESLNDLRDIMSSDVMKIAIKTMSGANFDGDFSNFDLGQIALQIKRSPRIINMFEMLHSLMECVSMNRIQGFSTEEEVEQTARDLLATNDLLAAVVFFEGDPGRLKRATSQTLPNDLRYKIRMDIDYVPSTKRLKKQFWIPGPESDFIEDLRYLRGFIQLQDSIDKALIQAKAPQLQKWKTLTQQMPYPCWKEAPFQSTLYESQGIQMAFFFALMMVVGSAVRYIVWEKESQNAMVMSVMGLKPWRNTLAWFITTLAEVMIIMLTVFIILIGGGILPKTDPLLMLLLMFDYAFSIVTFCYMISTMFNSASLAAVTTVVMFLLTYMPYIIVIAMEASMDLIYKILMCLSMSTSFCYGCLYAARKEVQGVGLRWSEIWDEASPGDTMSLGLVLVLIFIDGCIYGLIGYFVRMYSNSGKGFHELRSRSLWWADSRTLYGRPSYFAFINNLYFTNAALHSSSANHYQDIESDATSLTRNEKQAGVSFENVRKVYRTNEGRDCVAVDDFNLKLCEGEVTSLLGRNGAGKTTLIKMLTGMICPSNGEIVLNGDENKRPDIGVCPQDNVLIDTLTPREHMIFYAKLKRQYDESKLIKNVDKMMSSLELGKQENEPVSRLSGGTKRRLCVALAFLGSPKLVILDEPGAGVDPAARRRIWRLIDEYKVGRTVLLSTHHLDEADMLSDTVVVMHKGKILRHGSPLFLKMTCGRGYRMHVSYPPKPLETPVQKRNLQTLSTLVESVISNAQLQETSTSEVLIVLPFQSKHGVNNDIAGVAKILEENRKLLGFSHFSLECDTLERVFLDLCEKEESETKGSQDNNTTSMSNGIYYSPSDVELIGYEPTPRPTAFKQVTALLTKKLWHFARDWRAPLAALFLPMMFVAVAMGFSLIRPPSGDEPPLILSPKLYDAHPTYFYSIDDGSNLFFQRISMQLHERFGDDYAGAWQVSPNDTGTCYCFDGQQTCHGQSQSVEGLFQTLPGRDTLDWIVSTHQQYIERRYGGWSLSHSNNESVFVVWYNNKGHHSLPSYLNALNEAILRSSGVPGRLTVVNHPLKLSSDQLNRTTLLQHVADVGVALVLLVAFNLVGAQGARELVRERLSEEKRILYLAGMHPITYWTTAFLWDFFVFSCATCLAVIVFEIFGLPAYVARDNLPGIILLLTLFSWAIIPVIHLSEKCFDDVSLSNMVLFCVNTFIGVVSLATILIIDILGKTQTARDVRHILHHVLLLLPQYALGDALVEMTKNDIAAQLLNRFDMDVYMSPLGWDLLGLHFVLLFVVGAVSYLANLIIECRALPCRFKRHTFYDNLQEDEDVSRERFRVESHLDHDVLRTINLRKEYRSVYGTNVAVQNLSFGVEAGSCFGLLGVNGAGKSTTFKMLTTETIPTAGRIFFRDTDIGDGPLCNGEVGYCPQWDALDSFLTPHQTLTIHGQVCGLLDVPRAVERMLKRFDLVKYAHRRIDRLSGGNRRKLCAAVSVMAPSAIVLMDEPTSGMDPATKELVSKAIQHVTRFQGCVILTSHSVADCEKICTKVGILAKGGFKCFGTPAHLKHKFSRGYVAFLRFSQAISRADLKQAISRHLPEAVISSSQAVASRLWLPRNPDTCLSETFVKLKQLAEELKVTDYTLTQSSLDQVLVNFSEELEEESVDSRYAQDNLAFNRDSIHMDTF